MDFDDLDNALFGKSSSKATISNIDSLFSNEKVKQSTERKPTVSFLEKNDTTTHVLDDLFGERKKEKPAEGVSSRPTRNAAQSSSLSSIMSGSKRQDTEVPTPSQTSTEHKVESTAQLPNLDNVRTQRLEDEIERLNREIVDLKRKMKNEEEDLEERWKSKMERLKNEHQKEVEESEKNMLKQMKKMEIEHAEELERMKTTYERQLDSMQSTATNSRDLTGMVDRVDHISQHLDRLTNEVASSTERTLKDREMAIQIKEESLKNKEERLSEEYTKFQQEKAKMFEWNTKLNDIVKNQESSLEQSKWRVRDEWNRLSAEKEIFKEDQKYISGVLEKQKAFLEKSKTSFLQEQHDLLVRVSLERTQLDQEKNEFYGKRSFDIRRLKEEAKELQQRVEAVQTAEKQVDELRWHYETKLSQLQELEVTLMEECVEMENMRNQLSIIASSTIDTQGEKLLDKDNNFFADELNSKGNDNNLTTWSHSRALNKDSARTIFKKHSAFLEKYVGQKVATVAPQSNQQPPQP